MPIFAQEKRIISPELAAHLQLFNALITHSNWPISCAYFEHDIPVHDANSSTSRHHHCDTPPSINPSEWNFLIPSIDGKISSQTRPYFSSKTFKYHNGFTHPHPFSVYDAKTKRSLKRAPSQQAACKPTSLCPTHLAGDVR